MLQQLRPDTSAEAGLGRARVRCPRCGWEPDGRAYWKCDACLTDFDTFRTRATCPACDRRWALTQCPACHEHSPHEDWYVAEPGGPRSPASG